MVIYFLQVLSCTQMPCLQTNTDKDAFADEEAAQKVADDAQEAGWKLDTSLFKLMCGFFAFYAGFPGPCTTETELPFNWGMEVISVRLGKRELTSSDEFSSLRGVQEKRLQIE